MNNNSIIKEYFNNNEKFLALDSEPLEPWEMIHIATDWITKYSSVRMIHIFKIKNIFLNNNYRFFILDEEYNILEYLPEQHYFSLDVEQDIKDKIVNLFHYTDKEELNKEIIHKVYHCLFEKA